MSTNNNDKEIMSALKMKESGKMTEDILSAHAGHKDEIMEIFSVMDKLQNESSRVSPSQESLHQTLSAIQLKGSHSWSWSRLFVPLAFAVVVLGIFIWQPGAVKFESSSLKMTSAPQTLEETAVAMQNEDPNFFEPSDFDESSDIQLVSSDISDDNFATLYDSTL